MQKYRTYRKILDYSYVLGIFPTIELLRARKDIKVVFTASHGAKSDGIKKIRTLCKQANILCIEDEKTVKRIAKVDNCYAVAVFSKYSTNLAANKPHIVIVNPDDAGNLGTILRTMLGFNYYDLAIIRPAVDVFDPKVIRASMGSIFSQRVAYFDSLEQYAKLFERPLFLFMLEESKPLTQNVFPQVYSLVFGNEGSGLPMRLRRLGTAIRIEQTQAIDSLNLAVAASVAMHYVFTAKTK